MWTYNLLREKSPALEIRVNYTIMHERVKGWSIKSELGMSEPIPFEN